MASDRRFKYDVKDNVPGLEFINKLRPVTYYFDEDKLAYFTKTGIIPKAQNNMVKQTSYQEHKNLRTGFLAQDVEKLANELGYDFDGVHVPTSERDHYSIAYSQFIMPLVKSVQEQQIMIEELNKKLSSQDDQIKRLNEKVNALLLNQNIKN
jgi:hypothetical protein